MLNNFPTQPSGTLLHTLSKLYDVPVCFIAPPPSSEAVYSGLQREADARYRMICLVMIMINLKITNLVEDVPSLLSEWPKNTNLVENVEILLPVKFH